MKRILVVDDNDLLCRLTCDILRSEGYWVKIMRGEVDPHKILDNRPLHF